MKNQWTWAAVLGCALAVGCGDRQAETTQNLELEAPAAGPENAGVAGTGPAVNPAQGAPASPRRDGSA